LSRVRARPLAGEIACNLRLNRLVICKKMNMFRDCFEENHKMCFALHRRGLLRIGVGAFAAMVSCGGLPQPAFAARNDSEELIKKFTGGKTAVEARVRLDLPEIAENGNTVPMTVSVESPMTEESYVSDILIVADGNPRGGIATFHFSPASGIAEVNTRIRLAETENVIAIAKMNDGSVFTASKQVKITIGGCGG
jgi:sulfur-oxidizing protein SoxY